MSLLDDTIFQGPHGLLRYIEPEWLSRVSRIKKLEIHTLKNNGREDRFYLYAWGMMSNARVRTILNINLIEIIEASTHDVVIEKISLAIQQAIPILQTTLRLAGEP